ncbi:DUF3035 domain-containing protein [Rhodobacteraceae bacterium DSL-40]|uniref:DUF3035 domain-containing protein n=1 Tax=Amaricoccus sp. B4 TaxID=3368557 RepID=UPI000DACBAC3
MLRPRPTALLALVLLPAALALAGCTGNRSLAGILRNSGVTSTPDEFMVLPTRPLEIPQNLAELPPPTPGQPNRVDYQPQRIAVAGLTGREAPPGTASAAPLLARMGPIDPQIRAKLAVEDADYRSVSHGLFFERMFSRDKLEMMYRPMILDPGPVYEEMRARGVKVSTPPPSALENN